MRKLGKESGAIGFAVYLDLLGELEGETCEYDVDALVLYDDMSSSKELLALTDFLAESGNRVLTSRRIPDGLKYKELIDKRGGRENGNA